MAKCKWCGRTGLSWQVTRRGKYQLVDPPSADCANGGSLTRVLRTQEMRPSAHEWRLSMNWKD